MKNEKITEGGENLRGSIRGIGVGRPSPSLHMQLKEKDRGKGCWEENWRGHKKGFGVNSKLFYGTRLPLKKKTKGFWGVVVWGWGGEMGLYSGFHGT